MLQLLLSGAVAMRVFLFRIHHSLMMMNGAGTRVDSNFRGCGVTPGEIFLTLILVSTYVLEFIGTVGSLF